MVPNEEKPSKVLSVLASWFGGGGVYRDLQRRARISAGLMVMNNLSFTL